MIKHLKDSTNVVSSNKSLGLSMALGLSALVVLTLIRVLLPQAPLIDSTAADILAAMLFVFTLIAYVGKSAEMKKFFEKKSLNKTIARMGALILYGLFCIPLVLLIPETINTDFQIENGIIQAIIRVAVGFALVIPAAVIYRKWR